MSKDEHIAVLAAEVNGGEYSPTGLRFDLDVDTFPSVKASIADPKSGDPSLQAPVSKEVLARIGELQKQRLAGRTEPDFEVTAEDGRGGEIDYEGFIAAPLLELSKVSTHDRLSSVGRVAMIDALDLSIYAAGYSLEREEAGTDLKPVKAAKDGDVTKVLAEITDTLVGNYGVVETSEYMPVAKELLRIQHGINNSGPLELWKKILDDSDVKYESWGAAFKVSPAIARALTERTRDFLEAQNSGFWAQVQSMMSSFNMFYVPEFNGTGRFERSDKKMEDPKVTINASVTNVSVADGSTRILQPGGVVMMARAAPTERQESQPDPNIPRVVAYAPNPLVAGFIEKTPVPFWLTREEGVPIFGSEIDRRRRTVGQVALDLAKRDVERLTGYEFRERVATVSTGVMTELCEVIFKDLQLAQSTASLTLPLDFTLHEHVGKRATVKLGGKDGGEFTAFVHGVTHSVDLREGKHLESSTEVRLSHADYR